jgi:hypothetical protein
MGTAHLQLGSLQAGSSRIHCNCLASCSYAGISCISQCEACLTRSSSCCWSHSTTNLL